MRVVFGALGLFFAYLTSLDMGYVITNLSANGLDNYIIGTVFKLIVAIVLLIFAFQKEPTGV